MEKSKAYDRVKSRYGFVKKALHLLLLLPLTLSVGVKMEGQPESQNVTSPNPCGQGGNWIFLSLILLWTLLSSTAFFLETRLFRVYKCLLKRGVYAVRGNDCPDYSGALSDIFKRYTKFMYVSDGLSTPPEFVAGCETNGIGIDETDEQE